MMKALSLFGSKSDKPIFEDLQEQMKEAQIDYHFDVISAHRNPDKLLDLMKNCDFDFVIAGAGLAAHLPGVMASHSYRPTFGIPVDSQFSGFDAFFSIVQMPFGIPVLSSMPNEVTSIISLVKSFKNQEGPLSKVNIVVRDTDSDSPEILKEVKRVKELAKSFSMDITVSNAAAEKAFNLVTVSLGKSTVIKNEDSKKQGPCIHTGFINAQDLKSGKALLKYVDLQDELKDAVFSGTNNLRNAFLSAVEFMNNNNDYTQTLIDIRQGKIRV